MHNPNNIFRLHKHGARIASIATSAIQDEDKKSLRSVTSPLAIVYSANWHVWSSAEV
jgi:hypothetical protein